MKKFKCVQVDKIIFGLHEELSKLAKNEFALAYGSFRFVEELALLGILYPKQYETKLFYICTSTLRDGKYDHFFSVRNSAGQLENRCFHYSRTQVEYLIKFARYLMLKTLNNYSKYEISNAEVNEAYKELADALVKFQDSIQKKEEKKKGE